MRPAPLLLTARRKIRLPGSLSLQQDMMLRRRHTELTRAASPYRGQLYASHSDIATHMPKKLYFTFHVPGREEAADRIWRRRIQAVPQYFPAFRVQRLGEILHDLRAYEIPLTYGMSSDLMEVLGSMEEHVDDASRPQYAKLKEAVALRHRRLEEQHRQVEARKERQLQQALAAAAPAAPETVTPVAPPPTWYDRVMALPREVQSAGQQLLERFRS
eukprot:EG_transcript_22173